MSAAHTPGPWEWRLVKVQYEISSPKAGAGPVAYVHGVHVPEEESVANARLIAAAPTLLDACTAQHEALDTLLAFCIAQIPGFMPTRSAAWPAIVQGNEAIAAATGAAQ